MTTYNKLVRDKIPEILDVKGIAYEKRIADPEEYTLELIKKLGEEIQEFSEAGDVEELADIVEVIEALKCFLITPTSKLFGTKNVKNEAVSKRELSLRGKRVSSTLTTKPPAPLLLWFFELLWRLRMHHHLYIR